MNKGTTTMTRAKRLASALITLAWVLPLSFSADAALLGPTPYASSADSPFSPFAGFTYFHLENFDDHLLNTPGVSVTPGTFSSATTGFNGSIIDQVGLPGGCPPGGLNVACDTWFGNGATGLSFSFDATILGALPNAVGIVWTDGAGTTSFEAFDANGVSLGVIGPVAIADGSFFGTTAEDRFFGITSSVGIARIRISNTSGGIEVDHLQYGLRGTVTPPPGTLPEPGSLVLLGVGLAGFWLTRRKPRSIQSEILLCQVASSAPTA